MTVHSAGCDGEEVSPAGGKKKMNTTTRKKNHSCFALIPISSFALRGDSM
jgi:hypothetical protein